MKIPEQYEWVVNNSVIDIMDEANKIRMVYTELGCDNITLYYDEFTVTIEETVSEAEKESIMQTED